MNRENTRKVKIGNITIGGENKVVIQSMCNTLTKDTAATIKQIKQLEDVGCQIIRCSVLDLEDAYALRKIKENISIPLVADIHFDYRLALASIESGVDKIRLNPGNIGGKENVRKVVEKCKEKNIPIRIGINSGSLEKSVLDKYGHNCPEAMIQSAQRHVDILEEMDFHDIVLSFKSSDVRLTVETFLLASTIWDYPMHLGVTEAGTKDYSLIKSSAALGELLRKGIGDTIRISISDNPIVEIKACKKLLKAYDLIANVPDLIGCPTCGRTMYDMLPIINEIEEFLETVQADIKVAVMGCVVNGPGEAKDADIGIAGGIKEGLLFKKGQVVRKIPQEKIVEELKKEILEMIKQ
ncbi:MAG: flavodoxin-dependent (E)-4-hydroxy-3-methylbut-2-enyl-diphosphate synthase [Bacillota bacterium]|nr:flavodoxin-dependent (E)-4-hydroxy-3-methylbut-2-enyl-diphosphate synthase [Bacillota bacterium]NLL27047.1 flavodoxin-dependent (E)-4-hydroxy-3-methylbut-2-enyl-diphosphate synthase [Erysipelotrichia bacterium]